MEYLKSIIKMLVEDDFWVKYLFLSMFCKWLVVFFLGYIEL